MSAGTAARRKTRSGPLRISTAASLRRFWPSWGNGEYAILIMPDHPTPLALRTHTADPVPYLLYRSGQERDSGVGIFTEWAAASTGIFVERADALMGRLLDR